MKKTFSILLILIFSAIYSWAQNQNTVSSFANLLTLKLSNGVIVHYPKSGVNLIYKYCKDLPKNDPFAIFSEEYDDGRIIILQMKIGESNAQALTVIYSDGPSDDPSFIFANNNGEQIETIGGEELFLSGNGYVYTSGHSNASFNKRSKYYFDGIKFSEVKQPFYYVGLKTLTTQPITIYTDKSQKDVVASIPINTEVEVLLTEFSNNFGGKEYFLIKTPFGLVGWLGFNTYNISDGTPLKDIYFLGD